MIGGQGALQAAKEFRFIRGKQWLALNAGKPQLAAFDKQRCRCQKGQCCNGGNGEWIAGKREGQGQCHRPAIAAASEKCNGPHAGFESGEGKGRHCRRPQVKCFKRLAPVCQFAGS